MSTLFSLCGLYVKYFEVKLVFFVTEMTTHDIRHKSPNLNVKLQGNAKLIKHYLMKMNEDVSIKDL